jgi:hypothetical protein
MCSTYLRILYHIIFYIYCISILCTILTSYVYHLLICRVVNINQAMACLAGLFMLLSTSCDLLLSSLQQLVSTHCVMQGHSLQCTIHSLYCSINLLFMHACRRHGLTPVAVPGFCGLTGHSQVTRLSGRGICPGWPWSGTATDSY